MKLEVIRTVRAIPSPESRIREMDAWKAWNPDKMLSHVRGENELNIPVELLRGEWYEQKQARLQREAKEARKKRRRSTIINVALVLGVVALYVIGCYTAGAYIW